MKKVFLGMALAFSVSMAEKSGAFLGGGFQYSNLENQNTTRTPGANNNTPIDTSMFGSNQTAPAPQAQATYMPSVMNTNNYGQMYGVDAMAGYKWFFGKTKRFGFRSYGYYSYNHANLSFVGSKLGIMEGASQVNNFTYGVGFDALYNFYESKEGYNTAGLFVGFGLGGDSFIVQGESYLKSQMHICNNTAGCSASMNTSYFQMPVEFGFRSNFSKHSGIEVGFKLPLFTNQFYKERGVDGSVDVFYKRNFSIYFNYMINF